MTSLADLDCWVGGLKECVSEFLLGQVNARLRIQGVAVNANQRRLDDGTIITHALGSNEFPKTSLARLLESPFCSPFVGYSVSVLFLTESGKRLHDGYQEQHGGFVKTEKNERVYRAPKRNLRAEAWDFMENDQRRTIDENPKCLDLLQQLSQFWEREGSYDKTLLARLSFVPRPAIEWGLKMMGLHSDARQKRVRFIRRYSNPLTDLTDDPLATDELKVLPRQEQGRIIAQGFRLISKRSEKRVLEAIGIDKKAGPLRQGLWRLILPPLVDYLLLLQGGPPEKPSRERAYREASQILSARYPDLWSHSPQRVKHFAVRS